MIAPVEHTWRLAPRWVIVARFAAAFVVVAMVVTPIALALHTADVRNNRREANQARIANLNAIERANAATAARIAAQQQMLDRDAARLDRQQKELAHGLALTEFKACTGRNALREQLVVIVSASPNITAAQIAKFRADLGFETCPSKPAPLPVEVTPPAARRSTTPTTTPRHNSVDYDDVHGPETVTAETSHPQQPCSQHRVCRHGCMNER